MAPSADPKKPKESKAASEKEWGSNTWNAEHVTKIIASSKDMIEIANARPGEDGKVYSAVVHRELLCYFSAYYTAALKGGFAEAQKTTVTKYLPYDRMADLVAWLYSGNPVTLEPKELFELYAFADEKMMLAFRRSIMTRLIQYHDPGYEHLDDESAMPYVKRLPESSGLFRYLVDYWVGVWARIDCRTEMAEWDADGRIPRKFFYEALEKFGSLSEDNHSEAKSGDHRTCLARACNYHEHVNKTEWRETCGRIPRHEEVDDQPYRAYYAEQ